MHPNTVTGTRDHAAPSAVTRAMSSHLPEKIGQMTAGKILARKRAEACLESTLGVEDDPFGTTIVKHVSL